MPNHYEQEALDEFFNRVQQAADKLVDRQLNDLAKSFLASTIEIEMTKFYRAGKTFFDDKGPIPYEDIQISMRRTRDGEWSYSVARRDILRTDVPEGRTVRHP